MYHLTPSPILSRGGQHFPSHSLKTAQRLSDKPEQELCLGFLPPSPTSLHYATLPITSRESPSTLDILTFQPLPSERHRRQKKCKLRTMSLHCVQTTTLPPPHLERPGDPIVMLCSTPHLPTAGCHTKDTPPKRQCQKDMDEKKSLRQSDAEIFHLPYTMEAQASARILLRVRVPSLYKAKQAMA